MNLSEAFDLIKGAIIDNTHPACWADLGCGSGIFTRALAAILPGQSIIYAIDRLRQSIGQPAGSEAKIKFIRADFEKDELPLPALDGILMANSLHYVENKQELLEKQADRFGARNYLIIEYDTLKATPWVPYPVDFQRLKELFSGAGFKNINKLAERKSIYRQENIYACFIEKG